MQKLCQHLFRGTGPVTPKHPLVGSQSSHLDARIGRNVMQNLLQAGVGCLNAQSAAVPCHSGRSRRFVDGPFGKFGCRRRNRSRLGFRARRLFVCALMMRAMCRRRSLLARWNLCSHPRCLARRKKCHAGPHARQAEVPPDPRFGQHHCVHHDPFPRAGYNFRLPRATVSLY